MTLLLTWVVPDGIVMGADSALTWADPGGETVMTLSDAYKIAPYARDGRAFGVAFSGLAKLEREWTATWLRDYVRTCPTPHTLHDFVGRLSSELNQMKLPVGELLALHIAGWERIGTGPAGIEPRFFEVSNLDLATAQVSTHFSIYDILPPDFIADIKTYRRGDTQVYPMRFGSAGVPREFSTEWITNVFIPAQSKMVGVQLPQPNMTSVAEYVRFLIGMVADSLRIARQHATVNRPVETLMLFPEATTAISTRY